MAAKPQTAGEYLPEETEQVTAACLTVAAILGDLMDDLVIVGGMVPAMICEAEVDPAAAGEEAHCGTTDLDIGLSLGLLGEERYKEVAARLRARGFGPDKNEDGRPTRQRWRWGDLKVTVDFLIPPSDATVEPGSLQSLEGDLAALVVEPLPLAFDERFSISLVGPNLFGDHIKRYVSFVGPAAFVVMKAFAYHLRGEPKDAYDLTFVLSHWGDGVVDIATRMAASARENAPLVDAGLEYLKTDFETVASAGPRDVSRFLTGDLDDDRIADAHGAVADLLLAYEQSVPGRSLVD